MKRFATCLAVPLLACATQSKDPKLVELSAALQNEWVKAKEPQELVARIRIGTRPLAGEGRRPIGLALVIDTSGSMEGEAIAHARRAAIGLVDALEDGDRISVIAFHSATDLVVPSTELDAGAKILIKKKLEALEAKGTTDLAGGLYLAIEQLALHRPDEIRRVVLLSDGIPNDPSPIIGIADQLRAQGVPVTALGLGLEFDETLLASIAQRSGGKFHFVEDAKLVASIFEEEVLRLDRTIAKNAVLELQPGPGVTIASVIGRTPVTNGRRVQIPLGDVGEDEIRDVLVQLKVTAGPESAVVELMDAVLWFDDATKGAGRFERRLYLSAKSTSDDEKISKGEDPEVSRAYALQAAAAMTMKAIDEARLGNVSGSQAILQQAEQSTRAYAGKYADDELQRALVDIVELQRNRDERSSKRAYDNAMRLIY